MMLCLLVISSLIISLTCDKSSSYPPTPAVQQPAAVTSNKPGTKPVGAKEKIKPDMKDPTFKAFLQKVGCAYTEQSCDEINILGVTNYTRQVVNGIKSEFNMTFRNKLCDGDVNATQSCWTEVFDNALRGVFRCIFTQCTPRPTILK